MTHIVSIGGTTGIGRAALQQLSAEGHRITVISRQAHDIASLSGVTHLTGDILTDDLPAIEGPVHGLLYCPGSINLKPFGSLKPEDFAHDYAINVTGFLKAFRHYLPALKSAGQASVVAFSTVAVQTGMAYHASIAAAKGAVEGLVRSLAAEYAPTIRFNAIAPSLTDTPLAERLLRNDKQREASEQRHPLKRIGTPEDAGKLAALLLTPDTGFITGQIWQVDGGMSAVRTL